MADLVLGLEGDNTHRKIDKAKGAYMAAVVERIGDNRFSVAHYYVQNGDKIADPDLELVLVGGRWYPAAITQPILGYRRVLEMAEDGQIAKFWPKSYGNLSRFARLLLRNIKSQQGDLRP